MNNKFYDVLVAKEYETRQSGKPEKRTKWNRVGKAWASKSNESLSFELYLLPNHRYVIQLKDREQSPQQDAQSEEAPF